MKVLGGCRQIADLDVVFRAKLEKTFEAPAGMFRALAFVTVRQKQDDSTWPLPFRFSRNDELIDDGLRAIREIAELRFPQAKHARVIERVTVIETEDGRFRKQTVVDANALLLFSEMHQWHIGRAG